MLQLVHGKLTAVSWVKVLCLTHPTTPTTYLRRPIRLPCVFKMMGSLSRGTGRDHHSYAYAIVDNKAFPVQTLLKHRP